MASARMRERRARARGDAGRFEHYTRVVGGFAFSQLVGLIPPMSSILVIPTMYVGLAWLTMLEAFGGGSDGASYDTASTGAIAFLVTCAVGATWASFLACIAGAWHAFAGASRDARRSSTHAR